MGRSMEPRDFKSRLNMHLLLLEHPLSLSLIMGLYAIREWCMNSEMKLKPGGHWVGSPLVRTGGQRTWRVGSIPARPLVTRQADSLEGGQLSGNSG